MAAIRTFYDELGVVPDATAVEIKRAFKDLARDFHPDFHPPEKQEWAHEQMTRLNFIVDTLVDDERRKEYDELIESYRRKLSKRWRTPRQEEALQREYARVSVEIMNLDEKYANCRLKMLLGGIVATVAVMAIAILTVWSVSSTFLWAFSRFIALVGAMIAGFGLFDYLGRGQYRSRITELESKRTVLKKRMSEAWSSFS
jgi:curved DNA-binding protein CbpA